MVSVTYFPQRMIILEGGFRNIDGAYGGYLATLKKEGRDGYKLSQMQKVDDDTERAVVFVKNLMCELESRSVAESLITIQTDRIFDSISGIHFPLSFQVTGPSKPKPPVDYGPVEFELESNDVEIDIPIEGVRTTTVLNPGSMTCEHPEKLSFKDLVYGGIITAASMLATKRHYLARANIFDVINESDHMLDHRLHSMAYEINGPTTVDFESDGHVYHIRSADFVGYRIANSYIPHYQQWHPNGNIPKP